VENGPVPPLTSIVIVSTSLDRSSPMSLTLMASTIMIGIRQFDGLHCEGTDFTDAIIDNFDLLEYLRLNKANPRSLPEVISNKKLLRKVLQDKKLNEFEIDDILKFSLLDEK
jgi:hypothetical protein